MGGLVPIQRRGRVVDSVAETITCSSIQKKKKKKLIVDFREKKKAIQALFISRDCAKRASDFLGVHITEDLTWGTNTVKLVKKTQQRFNILRLLYKNFPKKLMVYFFRC